MSRFHVCHCFGRKEAVGSAEKQKVVCATALAVGSNSKKHQELVGIADMVALAK